MRTIKFLLQSVLIIQILSVHSQADTTELKPCTDIRKEIADAVKKSTPNQNRMRSYQDMLFDCDDYSYFVAQLVPDVEQFAYACYSSKKGGKGHAVNYADCSDRGVAKSCIFEPQARGKILTCWEKSNWFIPKDSRAALCKHIGVEEGYLIRAGKYSDVRDDYAPRYCADHKYEYTSCMNCCKKLVEWDGRPNEEWLKQCHFYCHGKPGTPNKPIEVPINPF